MAYNYQETLKEVDKERYNEKLKVAQLSQCPYKLAEGAWSTDVTGGGGVAVIPMSMRCHTASLKTRMNTHTARNFKLTKGRF